MLLSKSARNARPNYNLQLRSGIPVNIFFFFLFLCTHRMCFWVKVQRTNQGWKIRPNYKPLFCFPHFWKLNDRLPSMIMMEIQWKTETFTSVIWVYVNSQWKGQKRVFLTHKKTHMVTFLWALYRAKHQPRYVTVGLQNLLLCCSQLWPCAQWTYAAHQSTCHCRRLLELSRSDGSWGTSSTYSPDFAGRPCHSESKQNSWGLFNNTTLTLFLRGKEEQCSNWEAATFTTSTS